MKQPKANWASGENMLHEGCVGQWLPKSVMENQIRTWQRRIDHDRSTWKPRTPNTYRNPKSLDLEEKKSSAAADWPENTSCMQNCVVLLWYVILNLMSYSNPWYEWYIFRAMLCYSILFYSALFYPASFFSSCVFDTKLYLTSHSWEVILFCYIVLLEIIVTYFMFNSWMAYSAHFRFGRCHARILGPKPSQRPPLVGPVLKKSLAVCYSLRGP